MNLDDLDLCDDCDAYIPGATTCSDCEEETMEFDESIKRAILAQMAVCGIATKSALAERAGMAPNTLGRFLDNGGNTRTLHKIAEALGVSLVYLHGEANRIKEAFDGQA